MDMEAGPFSGRRVAFVLITKQALLSLLNGKHWVRGNLPDGLCAVTVHTDFATQSFLLLVEGESLPYVREGDLIPRIGLQLEFEKRDESTDGAANR